MRAHFTLPNRLVVIALGAVGACTSASGGDAGDVLDTTVVDTADATGDSIDAPPDCPLNDNNLCPACCFPLMQSDGAAKLYADGAPYCLC